MTPMPPTETAHLFRPLHAELMALLEGLEPGTWEQPTSAGAWRVRDVVAHLLDVDLRRLSIVRDGFRPPVDRPIDDYPDLLRFLNDLNATWVEAARRISPALLVDLLGYVGPQLAALMESADPHAPAPLAVAWAGQSESANWLDVGREYTERWHHQDQIREAVGAPALDRPEWLRPVIEISLWALPHAYRYVRAREGEAVRIETTGSVRGTWTLLRGDPDWTLWSGGGEHATCSITVGCEVAARHLLHRLAPELVRREIRVEGDERLARPFLDARAVMV